MLKFPGQMGALFGQKFWLGSVEADVLIKAGRSNTNMAAVTDEFGEVTVGKTPRAWGILVYHTSYLPIVDKRLESGSPSEGQPI